ncbi:MAG: porin family protein [bacterium]|nr:porin family protein [bacterium]
MKTPNRLARPLVLIVFLQAASCAAPVHRAWTDRPQGEETVVGEPWPEQLARGVYVELRGVGATLGSDFDGDTALAGNEDVILLPDPDEGFGFGATVGYRFYSIDVELGYTTVDHDASFDDLSVDANIQNLDLNLIGYSWRDRQLQPYALLGGGFAEADLDGGSFTTGGSRGDAELEGGSWCIGVGARYYTNRHLSFDVRLLYQDSDFSEASGAASEGDDIAGAIEGESLRLSVGLRYAF